MFAKRVKPVLRLDPGPPVVDDAEVASAMARLADAFVAGVAADGPGLSYALEDAYALDALVDRYLATLPGYDARRGYAFSLGAYLGELTVRAFGGHWTRDQVTGQPGVLLPSGRMSLPMEETAHRLEVGMSRGLAIFFEGCAEEPRVARHATAV
jgi:hypothetical protein